MTGLRGKPGHYGLCSTCGKRSFMTKALAKQMAKQLDPTMRVYRCVDAAKPWHMGHLPPAVIDGIIDRRTFYDTWEDGESDNV